MHFEEGWERMLFENLKVDRVTIHEVFKRAADRRRVEPARADVIESLSSEAVEEFKIRVTSALSAEAKSLQMQIVKFDKSSLLSDVCDMVVGRAGPGNLHRTISGISA